MRFSYTTEGRPRAEWLPDFERIASETFAPLDVIPDRDGLRNASLQGDSLGGLRICRIRSGGGQVIRSAAMVAEASPGYILLALERARPYFLNQHGRRGRGEVGDLMYHRTDHPFVLEFPGRADLTLVCIPEALLGLGERVLTGSAVTTIPLRRGAGRLLGPLLTEIATRPADYQGPGEQDTANAVVDLFRATLLLQAADELAPSGGEQLRERILAYIEDNLGDPDLSPARVAQEHHISVRYLHLLFAGSGTTFSGRVRQQRLGLAARELRSRQAQNRTIESIARRSGFTDPAHFSRLFRRVYGTTPRAWRAEG